MNIIKQSIIHRKYPDKKWEFKAVSIRINDNGKLKDIIYGKGIDKGKKFESIEMYSGKNYIIGSKEPSYSRLFSLKNIPKKYLHIVNICKKIHTKTKWSNTKKWFEHEYKLKT